MNDVKEEKVKDCLELYFKAHWKIQQKQRDAHNLSRKPIANINEGEEGEVTYDEINEAIN